MKRIFDQNGNRAGFSRYEIFMVLSLLLLLSTVVVPEISRSIFDSKLLRLEKELKRIKVGLNSCRADLGCYPPEADPSTDPGLMSRENVPEAFHESWGGPYLDRWPASHPWGGTYQYEYGRHLLFDYDTDKGNEACITVRGGLDREVLQKIDSLLDDGLPCTGFMKFNASNTLKYYVGEGRCWTDDGVSGRDR